MCSIECPCEMRSVPIALLKCISAAKIIFYLRICFWNVFGDSKQPHLQQQFLQCLQRSKVPIILLLMLKTKTYRPAAMINTVIKVSLMESIKMWKLCSNNANFLSVKFYCSLFERQNGSVFASQLEKKERCSWRKDGII